MNTDLRLDVTLPGHRKLRRLERVVGNGAMKHLICLWVAVATGAPTGDLTGWTEEDIEAAADWEGDPGMLCEALVRIGWIDGEAGEYRIHDWAVHQPWCSGAPLRVDIARKAGQASAMARRQKFGSAQPHPNTPRTHCSNMAEPNIRTPSPSPSPSPKSKTSPLTTFEGPQSTPADSMPPGTGEKTRPKAQADPPGFADFWALYPRRVGKGAARIAWERARKRLNGGRDLLTVCREAISQQVQSEQWQRDGGEYIPHPATWLNQDRWEDEVCERSAIPPPPMRGGGLDGALRRQLARIEEEERRGQEGGIGPGSTSPLALPGRAQR